MKLDGKQQQQLCEALLSAFPTRLGLKMMVQYELNQNLSAITDESNLEYTVFELIENWSLRPSEQIQRTTTLLTSLQARAS
ncbi:MAG: hypothetical protein E6J34_16115 [Chloroflexi bacterium]|nr:MAG: hypothetical protein E6J34_16115 [Chloroflexota bacterium]